jgi:DUF4097 and DUF4098 domain-containing protein YvlB
VTIPRGLVITAAVFWALLFLPWAVSGARAWDDDRVTATATVRGPVTFRLETVSADVDVRPARGNQVTITVDEAPGPNLTLVRRGEDRLEASFQGRTRLSSGDVKLELPRGSHLDLVTVSGDVRVSGVGGRVRFQTMSGEVDITGAQAAEVRSISGDVTLRSVPGPVRVKTVSGDVVVGVVPGPGAELDFETTSGDLRWAGRCGAGCRLVAQTVSGDLDLELDRASSVDVKFQSHSGDLSDHLGVVGGEHNRQERRSVELRGRYGKGEGVIDCRTHSGDLRLGKR